MSHYQQRFEFQHAKLIGAAAQISDPLTALSKLLEDAVEFGGVVELLDHKGRYRPIQRISLRISAPLIRDISQ